LGGPRSAEAAGFHTPLSGSNAIGDVLPEIGKNYSAYNLTIYDAAYVALAEAMKHARIFPAPLVQAQGLGWSARPLSSLDRGCT
jgi:hypothetical protein